MRATVLAARAARCAAAIVVALALLLPWSSDRSFAAPGARRARGICTGLARRALTEAQAEKLDITPDELFYVLPRLGVYHVDDNFRAQLTGLYRLLVKEGGDVLDLCSQHDSHLPSDVEYMSLTVHGMNLVELMANGRATDRFTQNFNREASLSRLPDSSMDAALMAVSIQYMQQPVELLKEVRRVLRPGGVLIVSFSNRMFFTKAIEAWRSCRSMRALASLVLGYFADAGLTGMRVANRVSLDQAALKGDPFVAVVGYKDSVPQGALDQDGISWMPGLTSEGTGIW